MRTALLVAAKDLRQHVRDRSILLMGVVAPLGLALIFSQLLAGQSEFHASFVVVDLDGGRQASILRDDVIGGLVETGVADVTDAPTADAARAAVEDGTAEAAFVIPDGFTEAVESGQPVTLEVIGARDAGFSTEVARSLATRYGDAVRAVELSLHTAGQVLGRAPTAAEAEAIVAAATADSQPVALVDEQASFRQLDMNTYFSASMAILFLFFASQAAMVSLFIERRDGTLARMLAGPTRPMAILGGKNLAGAVAGLVAMLVIVVATTLLIGADWGPPVAVALLVIAAVASSVGIATFVASFMKTAEGAGAAISAVAITLGILGGSFSPTSQAPELMSTLSLATPHGWFMRGLGDVHGAGAVVADALPAVLVLLAFGVVFGALGTLRARRLVAPR